MDEFEPKQEKEEQPDRWDVLLGVMNSINEKLDQLNEATWRENWRREREQSRKEWEEREKLPCICAESQASLVTQTMNEHAQNPINALTGYQAERTITCERHGVQTFRHIIMPSAKIPSDHTLAFGPVPMVWEGNPFK